MYRRLALYCLLAILSLSRLPVQAQIDTTGGRYYQPIFPQVTVTQGVTYGAATNFLGQIQTLRFDFYEPTGDTVARRPLIVFAHEGGFVIGTRNDQFCIDFATQMARLGYVVASIDYRLLFTPFDTVNLAGAAFRAMQDMRGAIRFFRADAAGANRFHVASEFIVAGGASAGAVTALQTAYLDQTSEIPALLAGLSLGTLEGTSGPAGFSSRPQAVVNLCGALGRPWWLTAGSPPLVSVHGTNDAVVPYGRGTAGGGLPPLRAYGSGILAPRATTVGVTNFLKTLQGAPHVPFDGTSASAVAYFDTTFRTVRDFLRPLLPQRPTGLPTAAAVTSAARAWPVPAADALWLRAGNAPFEPSDAELVDGMGRVVRRFRWEQPEQCVRRAGLAAGAYAVRVRGRLVARILWE